MGSGVGGRGTAARVRLVGVADLNQLAARIVEKTTDPEEPANESAAQTNGRSGGIKGGKARAAKLSPEERSEIARKAARARWGPIEHG